MLGGGSVRCTMRMTVTVGSGRPTARQNSCKIDEEVTHKAWLNRSNILFTGRDKWSLDKRVSLVSSNTSHFSIQIDDVQVADEGPYTCTFQANNKPRIAHVYLIVQVPARIVNISQDVLVNEGDNVNLFCLAVGRPEPTVTWKDQKSAATPGLAHSHACHRHPLFIVSITVTHYLNRTGA
ncbi:hypothetical protein CRUP_000863 [Coryphaenoides rupestris]|nr:hypothetical protein CRUP_000863 [Coryphaenoides rupestris]